MSGSQNKSDRPESSWLHDAATTRKQNHLDRHLREPDTNCLNFASNDYLGLADHPLVIQRAHEALDTYGAGSAASRLVTGSLPIHAELETRLAQLKGQETALVFGSGYMTNAGIIPSLVGRDDIVFADKLSHASILDAITLSRAKLVRFHHNDMQHLEERLKQAPDTGRRLIVTESVFSMDGDLAPVTELTELATQHRAMLMVDEAHATGIFGRNGCGRFHDRAESVTISMGTLSKALGTYGGFAATTSDMKKHLINSARAFIYTTAPAPATIGAALGALDVLEQEPGLGTQLLERAAQFRNQLADAGLNTGQSESQIVPLIVGSAEKALTLSTRLEKAGIQAIAIRPPTVPQNTARIRFAVSLRHTNAQFEEATATILQCAREEGLA